MDSSVITWVVDSVLRPDDEHGMQFVIKMMPPQKDDVLTMMTHCIKLGAPRCLRTLSPYTGPNFTDFAHVDWEVVRTSAFGVISMHDKACDDAIITLLDVAWLSWTQDVPGLLHKAIHEGNWSLAVRLIKKGYMEGSDFGTVLTSLWDLIEARTTTKSDQKAASSAFDAMLKLLHECKEESMQFSNDDDDDSDVNSDNSDDDDGEDDDEDDKDDADNENDDVVVDDNDEDDDGDQKDNSNNDDFSISDGRSTSSSDDAPSPLVDKGAHMQMVARRVRQNPDKTAEGGAGTPTDKMIQYVKGLFLGKV